MTTPYDKVAESFIESRDTLDLRPRKKKEPPRGFLDSGSTTQNVPDGPMPRRGTSLGEERMAEIIARDAPLFQVKPRLRKQSLTPREIVERDRHLFQPTAQAVPQPSVIPVPDAAAPLEAQTGPLASVAGAMGRYLAEAGEAELATTQAQIEGSQRALELAVRPEQAIGAAATPLVAAGAQFVGGIPGGGQLAEFVSRGAEEQEILDMGQQLLRGEISPRAFAGRLIEIQEAKPIPQQLITELPTALIPPVGAVQRGARGLKAIETLAQTAVRSSRLRVGQQVSRIPGAGEVGLRVAGRPGIAGGAIRLSPHERGARIRRFLDPTTDARFKATNKAVEGAGLKMDALAGTRQDEFFIAVEFPKITGKNHLSIANKAVERGVDPIVASANTRTFGGRRLFFESFDDVDAFLKTGEYNPPSITSPLRQGAEPAYVTEAARVPDAGVSMPAARFFDDALSDRKAELLRQVGVDPDTVKTAAGGGVRGRGIVGRQEIVSFVQLPEDVQAKLARLAFGGESAAPRAAGTGMLPPIEETGAVGPGAGRSVEDIDRQLAALQSQYKKILNQTGPRPPSVTKSMLDGIVKRMDKLDVEKAKLLPESPAAKPPTEAAGGQVTKAGDVPAVPPAARGPQALPEAAGAGRAGAGKATLKEAREGGTFFHAGQQELTAFQEGRVLNVGTERTAIERVSRPSEAGQRRVITEIEVKPENPFLPEGRVLDERDALDRTTLFRIQNMDFERQKLIDAGHDVVPFINAIEGEGSLSYAILKPSAIRITGKTRAGTAARELTGHGGGGIPISERFVFEEAAGAGRAGAVQEPWHMTRAEFRGDRQVETERYIQSRTGATSPQELLDWYVSKYPGLRGVTIGGLRSTKQSGRLANEGAARIVIEGGRLVPAESQIHLTRDATLVVTRHEIEHLLDVLHGANLEGRQTFGRFAHESFNQSDYLHRAMVRDALAEGKSVPNEVLRDYPDLAAGAGRAVGIEAQATLGPEFATGRTLGMPLGEGSAERVPLARREPLEAAQASREAVERGQQALPEAAGAGRAAEELVSPDGVLLKNPIDMTAEEYRSALEQMRAFERTVEERIFGMEGAKEYGRLQRIANSLSASWQRLADAESAIARMEGALTEEQYQKLVGRRDVTTVLPQSADELADVGSAFTVDAGDTTADLLRLLSRRIYRIDPQRLQAVRAGEPVSLDELDAAMAVKRVVEILLDRGMSQEDIFRQAAAELATQVEPADAAFLLQRWLEFDRRPRGGGVTGQPILPSSAGAGRAAEALPDTGMGTPEVRPSAAGLQTPQRLRGRAGVGTARKETASVDSIASTGTGEGLPTVDVWADFARAADPSGGPPPHGPPLSGGGALMDEPDDLFAQVRKLGTKEETLQQTLLRRHEAAITTAENEARIFVDAGKQRLRELGFGKIIKGRFVPRQTDIDTLDNLFEVLHNPSKVASGEMTVPVGLEGEFAHLRQAMDWESAMRIDFDPAMATVDDYFYRGWVMPKEGVRKPSTGIPRGQLGAQPAFKKPRVDATYREMRDAGFEPVSWNPYEQWRIARLQGVRYRQQMQLIDTLKSLDLAKTDAGAIGLEAWRTPKVGPAFEGKAFASTDSLGEPVAMYSRRWVVPDELAGRLENMYGVPLNLGKVHVGNRGFDLLKAIDAVVFIPKRIKLFGSLFQQIDFLTRSGVGAWTGMVDALMAGQPVTAVKRLAVWPRSAVKVIEANVRPGARAAIRRQLNSTTPIVKGRSGIHLRGIMEAGLSTIDTTLLPNNLDQTARVVADGMGLLANKAVRRAISSLESTMRRGLFEGTYPAAQITDIQNNIAPIIARRYRGLSDEALNGMIAKVTNKKYSTIPASQSMVQNRHLRELLRRVFFSMGESEGLLRQAAGAIKGPEAGYWRTHWIGAYLGLIATASAIHFASTGQPLPFSRWAPLSRDTWGPLPIGYNQEFAAPDIPLKGKEGLNMTVDLVGQLDTAFRILDPPSFLSSRESVPFRALTTQITERDFYGRPIDEVGPGGIYSRTANLINDMFAPIGIGQAVTQIALEQGRVPKGLIPASERGLSTVGRLVQATGVNLRAQYLRNLWENDLQEYKAIPTDPLKIGSAEHPVSRTQYRDDNPAVDAKLFITGGVESLRTFTAVLRAQELIQANGIDPDAIRGIVARKEKQDKWAEAGRYLETTYVDILISRVAYQEQLLDRMREEAIQPQPSRPIPTPETVESTLSPEEMQRIVERDRHFFVRDEEPTPVPAGIR